MKERGLWRSFPQTKMEIIREILHPSGPGIALDLGEQFVQGSEGEWADRRRAASLGLFDKLLIRDVQMKGQNIQWKSLGVDFPDFHPSSIFPKEGGISVPI